MITGIELHALAQSLSTGAQVSEPCSDWDVISLRDIASRLRNLAAYMEALADHKVALELRAMIEQAGRGLARHWHWRNIADGFMDPQAFASRQQARLALDPDDAGHWRLVSCGQTTCRALPLMLTRSRRCS